MEFKDFEAFMSVIKNTSDRISLEGALFDQLLEDSYGLPRGLCELLDQLVDALDGAMGGGEWVQWYCFDSSFGTAGLVAGHEGDVREIDTVGKLYALIVGGK